MPDQYTVLTDSDLADLLSMADVVPPIENAIRGKYDGTLVSRPKIGVETGNGPLVFTVGGERAVQRSVGFRVYQMIDYDNPDSTQAVMTYDSETGAFEGVILGDQLGRLRTGAIGGVAVKHLSREDSSTVGILGSGPQAEAQLDAVSHVRDIEDVRVYSPTRGHRELFAEAMDGRLDAKVLAVPETERAVRDRDVVICATSSEDPVFDADLLTAGTHVTSIGPKNRNRHELDTGVAARSDTIVTDSLSQIDNYDDMNRPPFFLQGTPQFDKIQDLSDVVAGAHPGRSTDRDITLFFSVGLAGTEVVVAKEAFRKSAEGSG